MDNKLKKLSEAQQNYLETLQKGFRWYLLIIVYMLVSALLSLFTEYSLKGFVDKTDIFPTSILFVRSLIFGVPADNLGKKIYSNIVNFPDSFELDYLIQKRTKILKIFVIVPVFFVALSLVFLIGINGLPAETQLIAYEFFDRYMLTQNFFIPFWFIFTANREAGRKEFIKQLAKDLNNITGD